jgi:CRP/FNR family transcriptional regulator, cyclic AMP receptor protein
VLRKDTKIELLKRVPLFAGCSKAELGQIAKIADEIDLPAGKVLIREGETGRQFYVVIEGSVSVTQGGRKLPVRGGSDFFGEIALLADSPTTATVTATSATHALVITKQSFRALISASPQIQMKVLRALAERLANDSL